MTIQSTEQVILVVDDEKNIVELAKLYLKNDGFSVETAFNGRDAMEKVRSVRPCLVVLDLMMPEMDGWEVCRLIRKASNIPIIILTARGDDVDRIVGLELGADDYMVKPFNPRELVARVRAVLRRCQTGTKSEPIVTVGNLRVDLYTRDVFVGNAAVELRPKEFDLLVAFALSPGAVFTREKLLDLIWGYDYYGDTRTVDVHVALLRSKLANADSSIKTVWGVGYKLSYPVSAEG